jgi:gamma-glutamyltranspeptidase/glutathione hydrolase
MPSNGRAKSLYGRRCAIVTGHHLATRAASSMVDQGGTLTDAMLAASAVLTVVLPHTSSLGGCAMALFDQSGSGPFALNGTGRAPAAATPAAFGTRMPQRGAAAAVTPTLVRFWARAHERFAVLPWRQLLAPAIELAEQGCPASEELVRNLENADPLTRGQPGFEGAFAPGGQWLRRGALLRQPALAAVLREIAQHGERGFYAGWVAQSLVQASRQAQGLLAEADLAAAQADWVTPWDAEFAGYRVHAMPPNSMGALMLAQLGTPATDTATHIQEAIRVIAQGQERIGDPSRATLGRDDWARLAGEGGRPQVRPEPGDTTGFVAMDDSGAAVAMLQSVFQPFGSGVVDPGTGVLLNNRMFDFSLEPGHVNEVAPGMRPRHTLNPYLVTRSGRPHLAGVSPGGISQTTTGAQVLRGALLEPARSLGEIVTRDRWSLGRDGAVLLEAGVPPDVAQRLRAQGLAVTENSDHEFYFGSAKVVRRDAEGSLEAAADPRRQANAAAW